MKCIICGKEIKLIDKVKNTEIYKCPYCGLGQTKNLEAQKDDYHRDKTYIEEEVLFKNIFQKRIEKIRKFKKNGKALEVGCSTGLMLSLLNKSGWEVTGIEISTKAAEAAKSRGVTVIDIPFEKVNLDKKFDLIIFNHTLEHLENPVEIIQKSYRLLNKSGLLYIDVPNFGGLSAFLQGKNWPLLLPNEHLWHFTEKSLVKILEDTSFKVVFLEKASGIWDYKNPIKGVVLSLISLKKRFFKEVITALPSWVVTKLGIGADLMVIAKKK